MRVIARDKRDGLILNGVREFRRLEAARTGVHVSTIINDILRLQDPARYDPKRRKDLGEDRVLALQETGNVIEDLVAEGLAQRIPGWTKPEPRKYRGIWGSPDGWSPRARCIDEIKACWVKMATFIETDAADEVIAESLKFIGYKMQIMFYMDAFDADRARLHVLFITGDHYPPFPEERSWLIKPTRRERANNFDLIYTHGKDMGLLAA